MGAGSPKLMIWLVMFAGWKRIHVGELLVEALAKTCLVFGGRAVLFFVQRDEDLAVGG